MRLVDADKLVKTFCSHCVDHDECKSECMDLKIIKSMKTVDAEPIIRCKDCIYWCECKTKDKFPFKKDSCNKFGTKMTADDFCSRGEKKDE